MACGCIINIFNVRLCIYIILFYRSIEVTFKGQCGGFQIGLIGRGQLKCDGTRAETRFRVSAKRTSQFKSTGGCQFSRLLAAEVCTSAVVMLDSPCSEVVWRVLATHSIRQFPLHFPPYVNVRHHISTGVYRIRAGWRESVEQLSNWQLLKNHCLCRPH